jgi:fructokinase
LNSQPDPTDKPLFIGAGELLWDLLPSGRQLGGAPANFAYHAQALGAEALVISRVGCDAQGHEIIKRFQETGLRTDGISIDPAAPTGTVEVALDDAGKPAFTIHENVAWDFLAADEAVLSAAARADAICFGTLAQRHPRSRAAIHAILQAAPPAALRIFDINLRQNFWSRELIEHSLESADVLKLNDEELPVVAGLFGLAGEEPRQLARLAAQFNLAAVALTKGARGSSLLIHGEFVNQSGSSLTIADTIGAGDSYTAALAIGLLSSRKPAEIITCAHALADYVCTQPGAMPPLPPALVASFRSMHAQLY